jgi:hypothetical protein
MFGPLLDVLSEAMVKVGGEAVALVESGGSGWIEKRESDEEGVCVCSSLNARSLSKGVPVRVRVCIRKCHSTASGSYECPTRLRHPPRA